MKRIIDSGRKAQLAFWILLSLLLAACSPGVGNDDLIAIPTTSVEAVQTQAATIIDEALVEAGDSSDLAEAIPIDAALADIDASICAEAAAAQTELAELKAQGKDVAELEQAVAELIGELENCQP